MAVEFRVLGVREWPRSTSPGGVAYLTSDRWDDFGFKTQFYLTYMTEAGTPEEIGSVKIGGRAWPDGKSSPELRPAFSELPTDHFSVGQDADYYERLRALPNDAGDAILTALRDVVYDATLFEEVRGEEVTRVSLLRSLSIAAVTGQLRRIARGLPPLTSYAFKYVLPPDPFGVRAELDFDVTPGTRPPTNIHVLIGRNGAGKTRILNGMAAALVRTAEPEGRVGRIIVGDGEHAASADDFANVVSVTFSAFDPFTPLSDGATRDAEIKYAYVGLKQDETAHDERPTAGLKGPDELAVEFGHSFVACMEGSRRQRWSTAVATLESDPNFRDAGLGRLAERRGLRRRELRAEASEIFRRRLSSGHSIVLLTITRLVEKVDERTLVLLDEPEAHLHPPLLSAFVRALSDLLVDRNGVAVVATHSPVVLQEVPRTCVTQIERSGLVTEAFRPAIETFGENVGSLTREIFGLEVTETGFYKMVREEAHAHETFRAASMAFDDQLGGEALALLRAALAARRNLEDQA